MNKIYKTAGGEVFTSGVGRLVIIVSGTKAYSDESWLEYCDICRRMSDPAAPFITALNYSPIVGPTAAQRKIFDTRVADLNKHFQRVVLVSDSAIVRGALTATTWLMRGALQLKAFSPEKTLQALAWLREVCEFDEAEATRVLLDLVREQGDDPVGLAKKLG